MAFENQLIGKDKYITVVKGNRKYLMEDFQSLEGCFVFATKSSTLALKDLISRDYYTFETFENNKYIVFSQGFPIDDFVYFKVLSPLDIISIPFTFDKMSSITPNALNSNFKAFEDLCLVIQTLMNERVLRIDKTNSDCMLPELAPNEVWKRKRDGTGWEGFNAGDIEANIGNFWEQFAIKTGIVIKEIEKTGNLEEVRLEEFTQEKIKQINEEGLKQTIIQQNHGFIFNPVQWDRTQNKYVLADVLNSADGMAIRIDDNSFFFVYNGMIEIPANAVDVSGNTLVEDEYYFLDERVKGAITPIKPMLYFQPLLLVVNRKGVKSALIDIDGLIDLQSRILMNEVDEVGLQLKEDLTLQTESKYIAGAINENKSRIDSLETFIKEEKANDKMAIIVTRIGNICFCYGHINISNTFVAPFTTTLNIDNIKLRPSSIVECPLGDTDKIIGVIGTNGLMSVTVGELGLGGSPNSQFRFNFTFEPAN